MTIEKELYSRLRQSLLNMESALEAAPRLTFSYISHQGKNGTRQALALSTQATDSSKFDLPRHIAFFQKIAHLDAVTFCPEGCCLARPVLDDACVVLGAPGPMDDATTAIARVVLASLAREADYLKEREELLEQVAFGEKIVQSMSSGFMVLAPDLTVLNANAAACDLLRTTESKLIGSKLPEFVYSKLVVNHVFATGRAVKDREVFIKLKDRDLHILKTAVPVFGKKGEVIAVLDHFREIKEARQLVTRMTGAQASFTFDDIIHESQVMQDVIKLSKMAAANTLSVLITGESGTGKELFAHAIHLASARRKAPFVVIDCASMPRELVASELFGYTEGAFTGARKGGTPGKFELANGGTIFLDELGELPLEVQAQFLRVLQNRQVMRVGGKEVLPVDIRVIAATNRDLAKEVRNGNFREDLYYRLNVMAIHLPSLRTRPEDVEGLALYFLEKYLRIIGRLSSDPVRLSPAALRMLQAHHWPGNVRELENMIARAVHVCDDVIEPRHLNFPLQESGQSMMPMPRTAPQYAANMPNINTIPDTAEIPFSHTAPAGGSLKDMEVQAIRDTIASFGGNISKAAKKLGISRSTIYKRLGNE